MNNMLIAQSGGPTAAINASLSGAIQEAIRSKEIDGIYGALNGIQGVLAGTIVDLRAQFARQEDFSILECTPQWHWDPAGSVCRKKMRIRRSMKNR